MIKVPTEVLEKKEILRVQREEDRRQAIVEQARRTQEIYDGLVAYLSARIPRWLLNGIDESATKHKIDWFVVRQKQSEFHAVFNVTKHHPIILLVFCTQSASFALPTKPWSHYMHGSDPSAYYRETVEEALLDAELRQGQEHIPF